MIDTNNDTLTDIVRALDSEKSASSTKAPDSTTQLVTQVVTEQIPIDMTSREELKALMAKHPLPPNH